MTDDQRRARRKLDLKLSARKNPSTAPRRNQFRRGAKLDETTLIRVAFSFCHGLSIAVTAKATGLSEKTVRSLFLDLRRRLTRPRFNRWHNAYLRLAGLPSVEQEALVRTSFVDTLADCAFNETCRRNYRLGNRKRRLCRACPLPGRFSSAEKVDEALNTIDAVHDFYERIGIRGEKATDPLVLFRLRLLHTTTVATALASTRHSAGQLASPTDRTFLSVGTLLTMLLDDLAEEPI